MTKATITDLVAQRLQRRQFLKNAALGVASAPLLAGIPQLAGASKVTASRFHFTEIGQFLDRDLHVPEEYQAQVVIGWGDALSDSAHKAKDGAVLPNNAIQQQHCFGFNNDFIAFLPLNGSRGHGLLCVNNEYASPHMMFPGYADKKSSFRRANDEQLRLAMAAVGHSVVEIRLHEGVWQPVQNSRYNRRLHMHTPMMFSGPAAGHRRLQSQQFGDGRSTAGTMGNCAGGKTPWGTVLIAEENFSKYYSGDAERLPAVERANVEAFGTSDAAIFARVDQRFDLNQDPQAFNHLGWVVEFNPYDPSDTPRKLTALGRFQHEGATVVADEGQPLVLYSGDDGKHEFVYRFVSQGVYRADKGLANRALLEQGILSVARFDADGHVQWLPLTFGYGPLSAENAFNSQADVLIECRRAAKLLGATPMDRPEDIETNPVTGRTYIMLTNNNKRTEANAANPRVNNISGHVLEMVAPGKDGQRDHTAERFEWHILLLAGNPADPQSGASFGVGTSDKGWLSHPDNVAFDPLGSMWIATDGCEKVGMADGLWSCEADGDRRGSTRHFLSCPIGAEVCGPEFTPDGQTLFVAIQHPGDSEGGNYDKPACRWPDNNPNLPPRPSVVAIRRRDGGVIGG